MLPHSRTFCCLVCSSGTIFNVSTTHAVIAGMDKNLYSMTRLKALLSLVNYKGIRDLIPPFFIIGGSGSWTPPLQPLLPSLILDGGLWISYPPSSMSE